MRWNDWERLVLAIVIAAVITGMSMVGGIVLGSFLRSLAK